MRDLLSVVECLLEQARQPLASRAAAGGASVTAGASPSTAAGAARRRASEDLLLALHSVLPRLLEPALRLLDQRAVCRLQAPSGRAVYRIIGDGGAAYYCLQTLTHCPCPAYQYSVVLRGEHLFCKHLLAARIGEALDCCERLTITEQGLAEILMSID